MEITESILPEMERTRSVLISALERLSLKHAVECRHGALWLVLSPDEIAQVGDAIVSARDLIERIYDSTPPF